MRPNKNFVAACVAATLFASWAPTAGAQHRSAPRPDPADPAAKVPPASYRSAFADYRPLKDEAIGDWRAANDEVGRIGGWREYLREAQAPDGRTPLETPPAPGSVAPAHGGHGMHGGRK